MNDIFTSGRTQAFELENRGPLLVDQQGNVDERILDAYWKFGFYVLEGALSEREMVELRTEFEDLSAKAPKSRGAELDRSGRPIDFDEGEQKLFHFVKPLTDPYGATEVTNGRYQVKMTEPEKPADAPEEVLLQIGGIMQFMDSTLRTYGHPKLLALAAAVNGRDFTPFNEVIWIKQARLGAAVSWHQDGTTHWDSEMLDEGTHGFNYMVNLDETTPENSLWVVPGTHKHGKADIKGMMASSGTDRLEGAVPLLTKPGDVAICNRQIVHGSFPNTSKFPRTTFVFGFHRRSSVQDVEAWVGQPYDDEYLKNSSQIIPLAVSARLQHYPDESPYHYEPWVDEPAITFNESSRQEILHHYHRRMIGI